MRLAIISDHDDAAADLLALDDVRCSYLYTMVGCMSYSLEEGLIGMKRGAIRRIVVPASLGYGSVDKQYQPQPFKTLDKNALASVLKNPRRDATLLWDVQIERIK